MATRLSDRKVLYFIAGAVPTTAETQEIAAIEGKIYVRSAAKLTTYGAALEPCDAVAGSVPAAYNAITRATTVDGGGMRGIQLVANRCGVAGGVRQGNTGGRSDTQMMTRKRHKVGKSAVKDIRLGFAAFRIAGGSGEIVVGNDFTMESAIEITSPSAKTFPLYLNNAKVGTVPAGIGLMLTDPILGLDLAADTNIYTRLNRTISNVAHDLPVHVSVAGGALSGEAGYISPSGPSQVNATGAITNPSGGTSLGGEAPALILGIPVDPMPACVIIGDSIAAGNNDTASSTTGAIAFIERGLDDVNGHTVPWCAQTVGSHTMAKSRLIDGGELEPGWWRYVTHAILQLGTNDISAQTLSTLQSWYTERWTALKRTIGPYGKPLNVSQCLILPRGTSNRRLSAVPTIANGGSGYANNATFDVTLAGGTLKAGQSATTINVTTNGSGVVTTVNSITNNGIYTTAPSTPNSPTGGAGTGLSLTCSFGGWWNVADQTITSGYEPGGKVDQLNAWFKTQVGNGILDAVIDHRTALEDPANPGYWLTNGTNNYVTDDGTHLTPAGHILAQAAVTAAAQTWSV